MLKGRWLLILLLSFSLVYVAPPQKEADAFIFRAIGAAIRGVAIGVGAAVRGAFRAGRFLLFGRPYYWGYSPYWRYGYYPRYISYYYPAYRSYYPMYGYAGAGQLNPTCYPQTCCVMMCCTLACQPHGPANPPVHGPVQGGGGVVAGGGGGYLTTTRQPNQPVQAQQTRPNHPINPTQDRKAWCAEHLPTTGCDTTQVRNSCTLKYNNTNYTQAGNNACLAKVYAARDACFLAKADPVALLKIPQECTPQAYSF